MKITIQKIQVALVMVVAIAMCSCSEDKDIWVNSELPKDTDLMMLDAWGYTVPFKVESNGEWSIESTGEWFYLYPTSGSGDATVQLCVLENDTEERKKGMIKIIPTTNPSKVQIFEIGQKSVSDYDDNGILDNKPSIKKYAVGYGYNTLREYASPTAVTKQIVEWIKMDEAGLIEFNAPVAGFYERTVTGSSREDLAQNLSASVNFSGGFCGFKGEVGASFSGGTTSNEYNEYAISYVEYKVTDISITTDINDIREHWLVPAAKRAIDGESNDFKGTEGVKKLLREYGTHLITKADLGGRLKYNLTVDVSKVTGFYDIAAYAKASYSNAFVNADASVNDEMKTSYENNKNNTTLSFSAIGGNSAPLTSTSDKGTIEKWKQSIADYQDVQKNKTALIGFGSDLEGLTPLYELATNPARRDEIKAVMEGTGFVTVEYEDKNSYHIQVPNFYNNSLSVTLVKDMKDQNGRVVATVCNEFIPEINTKERVNVVYPVVSGKVLMNAGFFIGYPGRRPARISWNGSNLKIVDYTELEQKAYTDLYIEGATTTIRNIGKNIPVETKAEDLYLMAANHDNPYYKYPLVKIFGDIWTREDYKSKVKGDGASIPNQGQEFIYSRLIYVRPKQLLTYNGHCFYRGEVVYSDGFAPLGWDVPLSSHYKDIQAMLTKYNLHSGQMFRNNHNSPLGYEAPTDKFTGWVNSTWDWIRDEEHRIVEYVNNGDQNEYWTKDKNHVRINDNGFQVEKVDDFAFMTVRLIKKN